MIILRVLSAAGILGSLGYYLVASLAALRFARRAAEPSAPIPQAAPSVAILKPLHGVGRALADNIATFFEAAYPRVRYFFAVTSADDPAAAIPVAMRSRYPHAEINLIAGEEPNCANRKIAKVIKMADSAADADYFVMSDADISVDRDHIARVAGELAADDKIGVVTCAYRARPSGTLASRFEALFVNTDFAPQLLLSNAIEPMRHAMGATIAIKRATLESIGGFRAVKDLLADDFYIGRYAAERGWRVVLSSSVVTISAEEERFGDFWTHQLRWARTYRTVRPESLATIAIHGPFWALVFVLCSAASSFSIAALAAVLAARYAMSWLMLVRVLKIPDAAGDIWMVPVKDLVMTAIWFASLASNKVTWGGRQFEILPDGAMREVKG